METLDQIAARKRCAIYNELSHMSPYYLTPDPNTPLDLAEELLFHKHNIYHLALTFDHILICTDNIAAFTRFASTDVVSKVIASDWFRKFLEAGIILLCGWGADYGTDLMENQIDYSMRYRPELKTPALLTQLREIGSSSQIVLREPTYGERDHVLFLRDKVRYLEGQLTLDEVSLITDAIEEAQAIHGFVGTMEIFPVVDDAFLVSPSKANAFYRAYFQSWQDYCTNFYSPAITVDSRRIRMPGRKTVLRRFSGRNAEVSSTLYSPDFFAIFLNSRLDAKVTAKLLEARPERLIAIRNGDWKVFMNRYHDCLEAASEFAWIVAEARSLNLLSDEQRVEEIVDYIFNVLDPKTDLVAIGGLLDTVLKALIGVSVLGPITGVFKAQINKAMLARVNRIKLREFEPFLQKLSVMLAKRSVRAHLVIP